MAIKSTLKDLKKQMDETYSRIAADSRENYINNLPVGGSVPPENKIMGGSFVDKFNEEAKVIRGKVNAAIDAERSKLSKQMAEAPSAEAVNAISLLKLRTDLTPDDINNMLSVYGKNYACHKAIVSIANDAGVRGEYPAHKYDVAAEGLDFIQARAADSFSTGRYSKEGCTVASTCGWESMCDSELPD